MANKWRNSGNSGRLYLGGGSVITADGDCKHEIKRCLLLGRKVMINLDSILKSRDITLPTMFHLVKAMVFQWSCMVWELDYKESWVLKTVLGVAKSQIWLSDWTEVTLFLNEWMKLLSRVQLFATPCTVGYQASLSMEFYRQESWSGLPFPSLGDLPDPGIKPRPPTLQADALTSEPRGKLYSIGVSLSDLLHSV